MIHFLYFCEGKIKHLKIKRLNQSKVLCYLQSEKFESLFYKINTCLQKTTTCIGLQVEQIFSANL